MAGDMFLRCQLRHDLKWIPGLKRLEAFAKVPSVGHGSEQTGRPELGSGRAARWQRRGASLNSFGSAVSVSALVEVKEQP